MEKNSIERANVFGDGMVAFRSISKTGSLSKYHSFFFKINKQFLNYSVGRRTALAGERGGVDLNEGSGFEPTTCMIARSALLVGNGEE